MNTQACDTLLERLSASDIDTNLLAEEIAAHMATCAVCWAAEAELTDLLVRYGKSPASPLADAFTARLLDRLCRRLQP